MEIVKQQGTKSLEVSVKGRLDGYWAAHLSQSLEESIQAGSHTIDLDLAGVDYVSSAGLRVLLQYYKRLRGIRGALNITAASSNVRSILETSGMMELLNQSPVAAPAPSVPVETVRRIDTANANLEIENLAGDASLKGLLIGDPAKINSSRYEAGDCRSISFPLSSFGLGLGALGQNFEECRPRFGEFVALGGAAAYLPTDGSNVPDYMISSGDLVPEMQVLYALKAEGGFSNFARFDAKANGCGTVTLSELLEKVPDIVKSEAFGMILLAESAGLVGAGLTRSPAVPLEDDSLFAFPQVRDRLMFTTERAHDRTLCAVAGVAVRNPEGAWKTVLRPLGAAGGLAGHFHAAVFPYRPLPRGRLHLGETVNSLFEQESMSGLLHLMADDREFHGVGQSEFLRGAFWVSPLSEMSVEN